MARDFFCLDSWTLDTKKPDRLSVALHYSDFLSSPFAFLAPLARSFDKNLHFFSFFREWKELEEPEVTRFFQDMAQLAQ